MDAAHKVRPLIYSMSTGIQKNIEQKNFWACKTFLAIFCTVQNSIIFNEHFCVDSITWYGNKVQRNVFIEFGAIMHSIKNVGDDLLDRLVNDMLILILTDAIFG
uniref:Uncharacterized protein n=1 Tax=Romanomermis culicivorax TaxID=13658 RepID=A0A915KF40_ROMCU